jgi:metal-sulfur cluster biosynthetic enzyme
MNPSQIRDQVEAVLRTVYDPEIPVNIYDLGLVYEIRVEGGNKVRVTMTLTAPACPVADSIVFEVQQKLEAIQGVDDALEQGNDERRSQTGAGFFVVVGCWWDLICGSEKQAPLLF